MEFFTQSVVDSCGLIECGSFFQAVTEPEARLLVKKYGVNDKTVNGGGFINYRTFCTDLQPPPPHINPWKTVGL